MAANKEIMSKIRDVEQETPGLILDVLLQHIDPPRGVTPEQADAVFGVHADALASALDQWVFQLQAQADLWDSSGAKGAKGSAAELRAHADAAAVLATGVRSQPSDGDRLTAPQPGLPPAGWCGSNEAHSPHVVADPDGNIGNVHCDGPRPPRDLSGLDALINERAALDRERMVIDPSIGPDFTGGALTEALRGDLWPHPFEAGPGATGAACTAMVVRDGGGDACGLPPSHPLHAGDLTGFNAAAVLSYQSDEVRAYIAGVTDELPAAEPRGETFPGALSDDELTDLLRDGIATPAEVVMTAREIGEQMPEAQLPQAPTLGQAGNNPGDYSPTYVPPGGRALTFAELLRPVAVADLPAHLSHSQINDAGDCATKYRAQRLAGLPEVPQWANIGGTTLHKAIEGMERGVLTTGDARVLLIEPPETMWERYWEAEIELTAQTSNIPEARWRSSRKGAEGRTWWEVNGPKMLQRYIDARPAEPTAMLASADWSGGAPLHGPGDLPAPVPAIEYKIMPMVPTPYGPIPFKAEIDRVTVRSGGDPTRGSDYVELVIRDYKSSYERPTDLTQLGRYAWALRLSGVPAHVRILGTYFDARRGEWTEPVDVCAAYPWEAFVYDVATAHANKVRLTTGPTPARKSNYCGGCAVRYACPIMALGAK